ncbi:MAG: hypothetical protein QGH33_07055 [Pirellulaceae bacterium]|jgi:uncharacterized membrane protein|nr:hypothetical protein [Pirellulaceae bacterium]
MTWCGHKSAFRETPPHMVARRHQIVAHRNAMIGIFLGALVVADLLTLLPVRIMHDVVFGAL